MFPFPGVKPKYVGDMAEVFHCNMACNNSSSPMFVRETVIVYLNIKYNSTLVAVVVGVVVLWSSSPPPPRPSSCCCWSPPRIFFFIFNKDNISIDIFLSKCEFFAHYMSRNIDNSAKKNRFYCGSESQQGIRAY